MTDRGDGREVVVVGVDGSAASIAALSWASRYAAATGATIRAVWAWHLPAAVGPAPVEVAPEVVSTEVEQRLRSDLASAVAKADQSAAPVQTRLAYGHPAQVLIDESKAAGLLVVGSHGHGAFTGMLVGSVSIHCVTHAPCPVVVVRGD